MTIEDFLKSEAESDDAIVRNVGEFDSVTAAFYRGHRDAMNTVLKMLPKFDHEVTVREVVEECLKHESEGGCGDCILLREPSPLSPYYCEVGGMPAGWVIDEIQKRMEGAENDNV